MKNYVEDENNNCNYYGKLSVFETRGDKHQREYLKLIKTIKYLTK